MALRSGTRLGPYEILTPIGVGGMGEVYKARDSRLDRFVAIKVLSPDFAAEENGRERLQREARAVARLNHPHICALYDIGSQDGTDFLVMELLEGETLAQRLARGPLPHELALEYGRQIAEALDTAHHHGIVHRDLKPGNVMLTKAGVKVLDFGLAKRVAISPTSEVSEAPTRQKDLTTEHALVGTLQYMAPEQLEGKEIDPRTDVFAFGAVLYEMLTGRKAFSQAGGEGSRSRSQIRGAVPELYGQVDRDRRGAIQLVSPRDAGLRRRRNSSHRGAKPAVARPVWPVGAVGCASRTSCVSSSVH